MKLFLKPTLILVLLLGFTKSTLAELSKSELLPKASIYSQNRHYAQLSPNSKDFQLLIKAVRKFLATNIAQIESQLNIRGDFSGGSFAFSTQINTIVEAPRKFRSEIVFTNANGRIGKEYVVVSDGNKVWIHSLQEEKYSIMTYESFIESNDDFLIGMLSSLFLEVLENTEKIDLLREISEDELIEAFNNNLDTDITQIKSDQETIEKNQYTTYSYSDLEKGFTLKAFINSTNAEIEYINLTGLDDEVSVVIEEKIIKKTNLQDISSDTFRFLPPINVQKVDEPISIEPF